MKILKKYNSKQKLYQQRKHKKLQINKENTVVDPKRKFTCCHLVDYLEFGKMETKSSTQCLRYMHYIDQVEEHDK